MTDTVNKPGAGGAAPGTTETPAPEASARPQAKPQAKPQAAPKPPPQPQERRGPGRPSKGDKGPAAAPPPADGARARPDAEQPKGRKGNASAANAQKLADKLVIYHRMVATFTKLPELAISRDEALLLAESGLAVADEFDLEVGGKWAVLGAFVLTAGGIYAPRAIVIAARVDKMKNAHTGPIVDQDGHPA